MSTHQQEAYFWAERNDYADVYKSQRPAKWPGPTGSTVTVRARAKVS